METTQKRKRACETTSLFDELHEDMLEKVLSWLPTTSFFHLRSVCKRWCSVAGSASFQRACSRVPAREPWFYMVGSDLDQSVVFDAGVGVWRDLDRSRFRKMTHDHRKPIAVASSGGLVCFRYVSGEFVVCNPVTGACRVISSPFESPENHTSAPVVIHAIAMKAFSSSSSPSPSSYYKLVMVAGEIPNSLSLHVFDSRHESWEHAVLSRKAPVSLPESEHTYTDENEVTYFLSKSGEVVSTQMQRSPCKQFSSVITIPQEGMSEEAVIYFLSPSGAVVGCHLTQRTFIEYPALLPTYLDHSLDVVECGGKVYVVTLSEFLESASLRVWSFSDITQSWQQVASMPPAMSSDFYGKRAADVNCVGFGDSIFICFNSVEFKCCFGCDLVRGDWVQLPNCFFSDGKPVEFMSAFSLEPRIEARV